MIWLASPVLVEQLLNALVSFVDTWLTGNFVPGEAPLAAIGLMAYTLWLLPSLFASVAIGATALVARLMGAGDEPQARRVTNQAVFAGGVLAVVAFGMARLAAPNYVSAMNLEGEAASLALVYLRWIIPVIPAIMLVQVGLACLRGAGDTFSGFVTMTSVNLINVAVGLTFVLGWGGMPRLGWEGLAIGTAAGHVTGALIVLTLLLSGRAGLRLSFTELYPDLPLIGRLFRVGLPGGADTAAVLGCHLWFVRIINGLGTLPASAHMLAIRVEALAYLPGTAFQVAAGTMAGQYLGAGDPRRAERGVWACCLAGGGFLTAVGCLFYFGAESLTAFFTGSADNPTAITAVPLLRLVAWGMPSLAITMVLSGALRGAGDTRWPFLITLVGFLGLRIPATIYIANHSLTLPLLGIVIPAGVYGAWCVMLADLGVRSILVVRRLFHGGWKRIVV